MLMFPARCPVAPVGDAGGPGGGLGRGVGAARVVAGVVGVSVGAWMATTLVRIRRLRRSAAVHAHDLDHTATVGEGRGEPVRLLVLGDSAARGYGLPQVADTFPHQLANGLAATTGRRVYVTSLAADGHRTAELVADQVPQVRAAQPDAVVVSVGVNDAIRMTPRDELEEATRALLVQVRAASNGAMVTFVTCPDLGAAPGFPWPLNLAVGARCRRVARIQRAVARELDVPAIALPRPDAAMFGVDGFHPGAAGQTAMAEVVVGALSDQTATGSTRLPSPRPDRRHERR